MKNVLDFLTESTQMIHNRLNPIDGFNFSLSVVDDKIIPDLSRHVLLSNGIYARRFTKNEWQNKLDSLVAIGHSTTNIFNIISSAEKTEYHLIASILFRLDMTISGQIDFVREYIEGVMTKEFTICYYNVSFAEKSKKLKEISTNWESGVNLLCMSIEDYSRNPMNFIKKRY